MHPVGVPTLKKRAYPCLPQVMSHNAWATPIVLTQTQQQLNSASTRASKICTPNIPPFYTNTRIHRETNRTLPANKCLYKHPLLLHKLFKKWQPQPAASTFTGVDKSTSPWPPVGNVGADVTDVVTDVTDVTNQNCSRPRPNEVVLVSIENHGHRRSQRCHKTRTGNSTTANE